MDQESARTRYHDDDLLTVAEAARESRRSVRTLRRAYLSGKLIAHRDGNGRSVTIRYGDLRAWLTAQVIHRAAPATPAGAMAQADVRRLVDARVPTGNPELLTAALQRRKRRARRVAGASDAVRGSAPLSRHGGAIRDAQLLADIWRQRS